MSSLQEITRKNGSKVHFIYVPEDIVAFLSWNKGDEVACECNDGMIIIKKVR